MDSIPPKTPLDALLSKLQKGSADYSGVQDILPAVANFEGQGNSGSLMDPDTMNIIRAHDIANFEQNPQANPVKGILLPQNTLHNYSQTRDIDRLHKFLQLQDILNGKMK